MTPTASPPRWAWMVRDVSIYLTLNPVRVLTPRRYGRRSPVVLEQLRGLRLRPAATTPIAGER